MDFIKYIVIFIISGSTRRRFNCCDRLLVDSVRVPNQVWLYCHGWSDVRRTSCSNGVIDCRNLLPKQLFPLYARMRWCTDLLCLYHIRYSVNDGWKSQVQHISRGVCFCRFKLVHGHYSTFHLLASHYALFEFRLTITAAKKAKINILWQFFQSFYSFVKTIFIFAFWWFLWFFAVACMAFNETLNFLRINTYKWEIALLLIIT